MKKLFLVTFLLIGFMVQAQNNWQWRGPERDGIYPEKGLLTKWPTEGLKKLWVFEGLGIGHASPAISNGKIYINGLVNDIGVLFCLDMNGKLLNKVEYGDEWTGGHPGARAIPTINDGRIYITTGTGKLICFDQQSLKVLWKKDLMAEFGARQIDWGINESSLIEGDILISTPGGEKASIVALDKKTGAVIWKSEAKGEKSAYDSPLLIKGHGAPLVVTQTEFHLVGVDLATGKLRFSYEIRNRYNIHPNTPLYEDGMLFVTTGYGKGCTMLKLAADGNSVEKVWETNMMDNQMGGVVKIGNFIYASGHQNRGWFCYEWTTGREMYRDRTLANGNIISAEGLLYCYTDRGELALVRPNPGRFEIISQMKVTDGTKEHWAHPVIHNKVLYVHHGEALIAYSLQ